MKKLILLLLPVLWGAFPLFSEGSYEIPDNQIIDEFTYSGIKRIVLKEMFIYDIILSGGAGDVQARVEAPNREEFKITHKKQGSLLEISFSPPRRSTVRGNPRITLRVPREIELEISTSTGDIAVNDLEGKNIRVNSTTGDIQIENCLGDMALAATTGDIEVYSAAGSLEIGTTTGDIDVREFRGDIKASSTVGDQSFGEIRGDITSHSSTGEHRFSDIKGSLSSHSTTGEVDIDNFQGDIAVTTSTGSVTGNNVLLTGNSSFMTTTGDVEIDLENSLEEIGFEIVTTTGSISVGKSRGSKYFSMSGGRLKIKAASTTGDQKFY